MKSFSTVTLFTYQPESHYTIDVPWPKVQEAVGEIAFRFLLHHPECNVYIEHDDHLAGFPTSRVSVDFLSERSQEHFRKLRSDK